MDAFVPRREEGAEETLSPTYPNTSPRKLWAERPATARRPKAMRSLTLIEPAVLALAPGRPAVRRLPIRIVTITYPTFSDVERIRRFSTLRDISNDFRDGRIGRRSSAWARRSSG